MAEFFMMCGVPGSGKSTYARNMIRSTLVVSTDYYIEQYAVLMGKTYSEVFKEFIGIATKRMNEDVEKYVTQNRSFVWDQTNLTVTSRARKLARIPSSWHKTIVWMDTSWDKIEQRIEERNTRGNKVISMDIVNNMILQLQLPTLYQGKGKLLKTLSNLRHQPGGIKLSTTLDEGWDTIMRIKG